MKHAFQILNEEKYRLEGLIRQIDYNQWAYNCLIPHEQITQMLDDVKNALVRLRAEEEYNEG